MDLGDFLADDTLGGSLWADEDVDFSAIGSTAAVTTAAVPQGGFSGSSGAGAFGRPHDDGFGRRERKEYPVPDAPPFRAMVLNLPWEANDFGLQEFFETLIDRDIIKDIDIPRDRELDRIRGFAFVEFHTREQLEEALKTLNTEYIGRRIFVLVAAPKNDGWSRVGGSRFGDEDVDLDWGAARSSQAQLPPRERGDRPDRPMRPRDDGPDLDWGSARGSGYQLPPRERGERPDRPMRPRDDGPDLDWSSARGSGQLPPREPRERTFRPKRDEGPDLDWSSARGSGQLPPREPRERPFRPKRDDAAPKRTEPDLDWSRGQLLPARRSAAAAATAAAAAKPEAKKADDKPQASVFSVLAVDDDDETTTTTDKDTEKKDTANADAVALKVAQLSVDDDGWEVVGK